MGSLAKASLTRIYYGRRSLSSGVALALRLVVHMLRGMISCY